MGDEGGLPLMPILDLDVVVPLLNIKLSKISSIFQLVNEVRDERKRVGIMGGVFIEIATVLTRVKFIILLFNKEERCHIHKITLSSTPDLCSHVYQLESTFT